MGRKKYKGKLGNRFEKADMERIGIFSEMPYMHGKGYTPLYPPPFKSTSKAFSSSPTVPKDGTSVGYFDGTYKRLFIGDAVRRTKTRKQLDKEALTKTKIFKIGYPTQKQSGSGDYYGTFSGVIEAFSRKIRKPKKSKKKQKIPRNFKLNVYCRHVTLCIGQYPEHMAEPYEPKPPKPKKKKKLSRPIRLGHYTQPYFEKNPFAEENEKRLRIYVRPKQKRVSGTVMLEPWKAASPSKWYSGGMLGRFSPFPEYKTDRADSEEEKNEDEYEPVVHSYAVKSFYTKLIIDHNLGISCNITNFRKFKPEYTKRMLHPLSVQTAK